ncbi:MAG TPA: ribosome biogenesis GTPase Der [Dehalococcoidia bacterium]|nr:ribosome biogenesis GTPase Der [Dehalococcoidia bacterium]
MSKPVVAIVGRQNVGKSTLLNRLAGERKAIVEDQPGTTRDRVSATVSWQGTEFTVVDTGGLELKPGSAIAQGVREQVAAAIIEADVIVFVVGVRDGVIASDQEIADMLRQTDKPVILVANKADNARLEAMAAEFYALGLGEPLAVSAHHGRGIDGMLDRVVAVLPAPAAAEAEPAAMKLAIVGRPNVGKSTLLNAIVGEERAIVDPVPGTTRDAVDTLFDFGGQNVLLIDTAGIRRPGRRGAGVEKYSVIRALRAVDQADVVLLVLDASELATAQDMHIAGSIQRAEKGIVLVVNKWDLVELDEAADYNRYVRSQFKFLPYAPVLYVSALKGRGVDLIIPEAQQVYRERVKRLPTTAVNEVVQKAVAAHNLPRIGGKQLKILYATQAGVSPPTFVFFVNDARLVHFSHRRYLENRLRKAFDFTGNPFHLVFKTRGEA